MCPILDEVASARPERSAHAAWSLSGRDTIAKMRIAVFGTGPVGRALAGGLLKRGHGVAMGTRAPDDPAVVARLADDPDHPNAAGHLEMANHALRAMGLGELTSL